jgi:hypothetical protein
LTENTRVFLSDYSEEEAKLLINESANARFVIFINDIELTASQCLIICKYYPNSCLVYPEPGQKFNKMETKKLSPVNQVLLLDNDFSHNIKKNFYSDLSLPKKIKESDIEDIEYVEIDCKKLSADKISLGHYFAVQDGLKENFNKSLSNENYQSAAIKELLKEEKANQARKAALQNKKHAGYKIIQKRALEIFDENSKSYKSYKDAGERIAILLKKLYKQDEKLTPLSEENGERTITEWLKTERPSHDFSRN